MNYTDAMTAEYHRLGDYIREVNVRNRELNVTNLLGLSMTKQFRPSTSNIVGVDLSNYKIVDHNIFAFDPMSVIRVHKVPIAINETANPIIVSPAYYTFEISDTSKLLPQYLMMWIMRPEFDRYADFKSDSAVRGGYDWKELCDTPIFVPSIERQREIVSEYETLTRRIRLNEQMIEKLEATAQALYHKTFVAGIDKQNLPDGWHLGKLGDFGEVITGKTPSTLDESNFGNYMPFVTIPDMHDGVFVIKTERTLSKKGATSQANKTIPKNTVCVSCIGTSGLVVITTENSQTNQQINSIVPHKVFALEYIYLTCCGLEKIISEYGIGGAVLNNLNKTEFENLRVIMPHNNVMKRFHEQVSSVFDKIFLKQQENIKLTELQSLLLAKMGQ